MTRKILSLLCFFIVGISFAQKKAITHNDYDLWKYIDNIQVSNDGKLVVSTIETVTKRGDGYLKIYNSETAEKVNYFNGYSSKITADEKFVIFKKKVEYDAQRLEKKEKTKKKNQLKEVLYIYDVSNNTLYDSIIRVKKYSLPKKNSDYLVIEKFKNKKDSIKGDSLPAWKNDYALIYNLKTKQRDTIFDIKDVVVPENGTTFYYTTKDKKNDKKAHGVYTYNLASETKTVIDTLLYDYKNLSVSKLGNQLAFIAERDSVETDSIPFKLFLYKENTLQKLVADEKTHFKSNQTLSNNSNTTFFSENGKRLYFYAKLKSEHKKDTTLLDDEIPEVDVWNWQDEFTQPRQKALEKSLKESTRLYYFNIENGQYVQLQDDDIDSFSLYQKYAKNYIIGMDNKPYAIETWSVPWKTDYYVIDIKTGAKRLLLKSATSTLTISTDGAYAVYFDTETKNWFSIHLETLQKHNLTRNSKIAFENEDNDIPASAQPYGIGGFDKEGNALLYDKYDIWRVALDGKEKPRNITKNGRKKKVVYRIRKLDKEDYLAATYLEGKLLIHAFDEKIKASGIYTLDNGKLIEKIKPTNYELSRMVKAKSADVIAYRKGNFTEYSNVNITADSFTTQKKITDANPHQEEFKWGTSELVSWKAYDGTKLEGIVYKPEDFDPSKKYPMIVYFYERSSDNLNSHRIPQPSASIVNPSYLTSNGYIMFVPDIVYNEGQPGKDAYNCVIPGVEMMEKKGYIDTDRMALQGQSWGGYQVAYLITKTNKFKAAMAGAPVSNMTSAYGGIRWASGLSRMFQYEKTQSRIGKTLWEGFDQYVESSPLFSLPSVETPLLIMHNDNDGAVPYYQGIELFMGMRRLQKPAWLLVYNKESHNLRKMKNKQDLSIRMMQFFDHYLKDAPAPSWMTKGVPRSEKGINFGYDLEKG